MRMVKSNLQRDIVTTYMKFKGMTGTGITELKTSCQNPDCICICSNKSIRGTQVQEKWNLKTWHELESQSWNHKTTSNWSRENQRWNYVTIMSDTTKKHYSTFYSLSSSFLSSSFFLPKLEEKKPFRQQEAGKLKMKAKLPWGKRIRPSSRSFSSGDRGRLLTNHNRNPSMQTASPRFDRRKHASPDPQRRAAKSER